jgi:hypothetical protein
VPWRRFAVPRTDPLLRRHSLTVRGVSLSWGVTVQGVWRNPMIAWPVAGLAIPNRRCLSLIARAFSSDVAINPILSKMLKILVRFAISKITLAELWSPLSISKNAVRASYQ